MSEATNKVSPEVRERAVRMVPEHEQDHPSRRVAVASISNRFFSIAATKMGQVWNEWRRRAIPVASAVAGDKIGDRAIPAPHTKPTKHGHVRLCF